MTQADHIISKFGGITPMSKILGHEYPTTVQGWKERGWIPAPQQHEVLEAAKKHHIELSPKDFFEFPHKPRRRARSKRA